MQARLLVPAILEDPSLACADWRLSCARFEARHCVRRLDAVRLAHRRIRLGTSWWRSARARNRARSLRRDARLSRQSAPCAAARLGRESRIRGHDQPSKTASRPSLHGQEHASAYPKHRQSRANRLGSAACASWPVRLAPMFQSWASPPSTPFVDAGDHRRRPPETVHVQTKLAAPRRPRLFL